MVVSRRDTRIDWARREDFQTVISAGCHNLGLNLLDLPPAKGAVVVDFAAQQAAADDELSEERTQFKTHFKGGRLATEQIVRLENGFPTTADEKLEYDRRQEANMKKLAEDSGFTVNRKAKAVKLKPNDPCQCGSGKKQKKCCGITAG